MKPWIYARDEIYKNPTMSIEIKGLVKRYLDAMIYVL